MVDGVPMKVVQQDLHPVSTVTDDPSRVVLRVTILLHIYRKIYKQAPDFWTTSWFWPQPPISMVESTVGVPGIIGNVTRMTGTQSELTMDPGNPWPE
jgi:hypothetical protein